MVAEETIMICIDNSQRMKSDDLSYELQLNCARSYSRAKLKSNPKILTLTTGSDYFANKELSPTSDLDKILDYLKRLQYSGLGGNLCFIKGILLFNVSLKSVEPSKLKRMLFFAGGYHLGDWKMALDAFVDAADNNNNSHIKHVQPDSSTLVSQILSRFL
ncbi:26S proteasome non-ATPase regulatory subunit 4 homolog [Rutidosis leptorrhynchoides]|uniref:26S proteasome non-ATPase regulatory subunit 4 homolog n=1 Tax=Rutidosis leptorrhynchoides TaxID=125765 RepID=UPI003A994339